MKDIVDKATVRAIQFNRDTATDRYYEGLARGELQSTQCADCGHLPYPPRDFCPHCGGDGVEWVALPTRGVLYAFTQQHRSFRFATPDVLGLVELPGVDGLVLTRIDAPLESLSIGQSVQVDFVEVSDTLTLHQFRPV